MTTPTEFGGRFVVGEKLVERPGCTIFKGTDKELAGREVAIKVFTENSGGNQKWIEQYQQEVDFLRSASHPALVPIIAAGHENGFFYMTMELIHGPSLRDYMKTRGEAIEPAMATELISQLVAGLRELHEKDGYHGHIDSRAILFKGDDARLAGYIPHVLSEIQKGQTSSGRLAIDPVYVAPEQISDGVAIDFRADMYALAVILYEMVTNTRPFMADNPLQLAMLRLTKNPESPRKLNPNVSPLLDAAIMKALARDPKERFASLEEFVDAITGGKKVVKNPLLAVAEEIGEADRISTETIAVSMSNETVKRILQMQVSSTPKIRPQLEQSVSATSAQMKAVTDEPARPEDDLSSAGTMMEMKVADNLKASFIIVAGDQRGKKFTIDKPQLLIGSDTGCDICLTGKNVPSRYAIVTNRGTSYSVGALSSSPLIVNGDETEASVDYNLKRGDVLYVGKEQLRFVAPGEVFTLQDNVADRIIDRPKSRTPLILTGVAAAAVILCGVLFYSYQSTVAARAQRARAEAEKLRKDQLVMVDRLRKEGDDLFAAGKLVEPPGENARERFEQIRSIIPDDIYAKRRLSDIEERAKIIAEQNAKKRQFAERVRQLLDDAARYMAANAYVSPPGSNAREAFQEVLKYDPQNEAATKGLAEVNRILGDFVGRIGNLVSRAKVLIDMGQYIYPPGENAFELAKQILAIDPLNAEAKALIIDMAARSLIEGDIAKANVQADEMKSGYITAKVLGVEPEIIDEKLKGVETIRRATSEVVIIDRSGERKSDKRADSKFLNMSDIEDRITVLQAQGYGQSSGQARRLVEIKKR